MAYTDERVAGMFGINSSTQVPLAQSIEQTAQDVKNIQDSVENTKAQIEGEISAAQQIREDVQDLKSQTEGVVQKALDVKSEVDEVAKQAADIKTQVAHERELSEQNKVYIDTKVDEANKIKKAVDDTRIKYEAMTATADTLDVWTEPATAHYNPDTNTMEFGLPRGRPGRVENFGVMPDGVPNETSIAIFADPTTGEVSKVPLVEMVKLFPQGLRYRGTWNPATNVVSDDEGLVTSIGATTAPAVKPGESPNGVTFRITQDGKFDIDGTGAIDLYVGEAITWGGSKWLHTDILGVSTVNGQNGHVKLVATDVKARPETWVPEWTDVQSKPDVLITDADVQVHSLKVKGEAVVASMESTGAAQPIKMSLKTKNQQAEILLDDQDGSIAFSNLNTDPTKPKVKDGIELGSTGLQEVHNGIKYQVYSDKNHPSWDDVDNKPKVVNTLNGQEGDVQVTPETLSVYTKRDADTKFATKTEHAAGASKLQFAGDIDVDITPDHYNTGLFFNVKKGSADGFDGSSLHSVLTMKKTDAMATEIAFSKDGQVALRNSTNFTQWGAWTKIYTANDKPTWADIGGNDYFTKTGDSIVTHVGFKIRSALNQGFYPSRQTTGGTLPSETLGDTNNVFKSANVENYYGKNVEVTAEVFGAKVGAKSGSNKSYLTYINGVPSLHVDDSSKGFNLVSSNEAVKVHMDAAGELYAVGNKKVYHEGNLPNLGALGGLSKGDADKLYLAKTAHLPISSITNLQTVLDGKYSASHKPTPADLGVYSKNESDGRYVAKDGTINNADHLGGSTKSQILAQARTGLASTSSVDALTKQVNGITPASLNVYTKQETDAKDAKKLDKTGGTLTGGLKITGDSHDVVFEGSAQSDLVWQKPGGQQVGRIWSDTDTQINISSGSGTSKTQTGVLTIDGNHMTLGGKKVYTEWDKPTSATIGLSNVPNTRHTTNPDANTVAVRDSSANINANTITAKVANATAAIPPTATVAIPVRHSPANGQNEMHFYPKSKVIDWLKSSDEFLTAGANQHMYGEGAFLNFDYSSSSHGYIKGRRGGEDDWYVGRGSSGTPNVAVYNYKGTNGINLSNDKSIYYNAGSGGTHKLNGSTYVSGNLYSTGDAVCANYQTAVGAYRSLNLRGNKGVKSMIEYDAAGENTNLIHRNDSNSGNRRTWRFDKDGRFHSEKGVVQSEASLGAGGYNTLWNAECPFVVENLYNRGGGTSYYLPMMVGKARPSHGAWLAVGFGGYYDGTNTSAAAINVTDINGKDQHAWLFKRTGDATGKAWVQTSDARLKDNIKNLMAPNESAMDIVNSFGGKSYTFKDSDQVRYGFIAQDVQKVYPHAVTEDNDGELGKVLGLNYNSIVPLHHEALKELEAENKALKAKNDELESRLAAIEAKLGL